MDLKESHGREPSRLPASASILVFRCDIPAHVACFDQTAGSFAVNMDSPPGGGFNMDTTHVPCFPHRLNADGTYDSICNRCFATVATASTPDELHAFDAGHVCRVPPSFRKLDPSLPTA
jgi:hypothetical protein